MPPATTIEVVAKTHPLRPHVERWQAVPGDFVECYIVDAAMRAGVDLRLMRDAYVTINGDRLPVELWGLVRPKPGTQLVIVAVPSAFVIPIIAALATAGGASIATTLGLTGFAAGAFAGVVGGVVGMLANMLFAPAPQQRSNGREEAFIARNTIQGIRNEARPYQPVSRMYGKRVNFYPALAALPYSEIFYSGDKQYLHVLFDVGHGPLRITDMRIGDTPLTSFKDYSYEIREGRSTDAPFTLFPNQVREELLSIQLKQLSGYSQRRTALDSDKCQLDVQFPSGLQGVVTDNSKITLAVEFQVQYKLASSATWIDADLSAPSGGVTFGHAVGFGGIVGVDYLFSVTARTKNALRRTVQLAFPSRGQYDVRIKRVTVDDQGDSAGLTQTITQEESYWTAMRSITTDAPVNQSGIARVAIKLRANDQLNGVIDQFNCTVESYLNVWDGAVWTEQISRSPAWAFADVLRGSANARPLADTRLDRDGLLAWATWCTQQGFTFDSEFRERTSVFEALQEIAATACASLAIVDGTYGVVVDNLRTVIRQHFTPRNLIEFKGQKIFIQRPHALKVRYPNERTRHQVDELIVYEDGYSYNNATRFEVLELPHTTAAKAAYKRARRALAAARLRTEIYTGKTDIEHLPLTRGDLVRVTHDVPLWGLAAARIKSLQTSGTDTTGVMLDAPVTMAAATAYSLRCRLTDDTSLVLPLTTAAGTSSVLTLATPIASGNPVPAIGDLAMFGATGSESVELLVRSVEPGADLSATITFIDYAPEVQTSATGDLPEPDPQITLPATVNRATPPRPAILSVESGESALVRASDGTVTSRIRIDWQINPDDNGIAAQVVQLRYRPALTTQDYDWLGNLPGESGSAYLSPVDDGITYDIEIRSVSGLGVTSEWAAVSHTVTGKSNPPPGVERFYRQGSALTWPYPNPPIDLAGFVLRANYGTSNDWGKARALHVGVVQGPPFGITELAGTQTVLIKAIDTSGIESTTAASVTVALGVLITSNVIYTQSEAPGFSGALTGGTDTGVQIEASLLASTPFFGASASTFYGAAAGLFYETSVYDEMTYTATYTPLTAHLGDGLLKIGATVQGDYWIDYRISVSPAFYGAAAATFYGSAASAFYDASTIGEWADFPGVLGPFSSTTESYNFRITTSAGTTKGIVSQLDLVIDVADIEEQFNGAAIAATTGTRLTLVKTYRAIDNINITLQAGGAGLVASWVDKQATAGAANGPLIKVYNSAGAVVAGTVDVRIKGH